jgi:hypothetical protein
LNEDDKLLNNQSEISNVFNNFFVNVAKDIGKDSTPINDCRPCICKIKDRCITNQLPYDHDQESPTGQSDLLHCTNDVFQVIC